MTRRTRFAFARRGIGKALAKGFAFEKFHNQVGRAFVGADVKNGQDVGVIEGAGGAGLLFKALQPLGIARERRRKDFDCDFTAEAGVPRAVNLSHSACTQR